MTERIEARQVFSDPVVWLAFGFGSGLAPRALGVHDGTGIMLDDVLAGLMAAVVLWSAGWLLAID